MTRGPFICLFFFLAMGRADHHRSQDPVPTLLPSDDEANRQLLLKMCAELVGGVPLYVPGWLK
jgi:hypothetical protein